MISNLVKFYNLTNYEKKIFFISFYYLVFFKLSLKIYSIKKIIDYLKDTSLSSKTKFQDKDIFRFINLVSANFSIFNNCLLKSITAFYLCKKNSYQYSLIIGISNDNEFLAHAWLEREGKPCFEESNLNYSKIYTI